jgi:hypothetical protein
MLDIRTSNQKLSWMPDLMNQTFQLSTLTVAAIGLPGAAILSKAGNGQLYEVFFVDGDEFSICRRLKRVDAMRRKSYSASTEAFAIHPLAQAQFDVDNPQTTKHIPAYSTSKPANWLLRWPVWATDQRFWDKPLKAINPVIYYFKWSAIQYIYL